MALKARGIDLVYSRYQEVEITGELPNRGGKYSAKCRVADVVPLTVMKAVCMEDRYKSKDANDLYYTIRHYPDGVPAIVAALKTDLNNGLVKEALQRLQKLFESQTVTAQSLATTENLCHYQQMNPASSTRQVFCTTLSLIQAVRFQ